MKVLGIQNAYIITPVKESISIVPGSEFGEDYDSKAILVCALYGLKSSGYVFMNHIADCMHHLGFLPFPADLYLWMKHMVRPEDGFHYYDYVLIYVDDVIVIHHETESILRRIYKYFKLNPSSVSEPEIYLGDKLKKMRLENGEWAWENSPEGYLKELISNFDKYLVGLGDTRWQLPNKKDENTFVRDYAPDMNNNLGLEQELASWYHYFIGMLRWMVEIGRVDIITEVSMMASEMATPRKVRLEAVLNLFVFIRQNYNSRMNFDPTYPTINMIDFKECKWKDFYSELKQVTPPNASEKRGKEFDPRWYVDSNNTGEKKARRSYYVFFIFLNKALIQWFSKKLSMIEMSMFGEEFVDVTIVTDTL